MSDLSFEFADWTTYLDKPPSPIYFVKFLDRRLGMVRWSAILKGFSFEPDHNQVLDATWMSEIAEFLALQNKLKGELG